jgi:signal transduction histidine kinase
MARTPRTPLVLTISCLLLLGVYAAVSVLVPPGPGRTAFGDIFQCLLPLLVNGVLLMNAVTPNWRKNYFWMLLALGGSLWLGGQFIRTYTEVYQHGAITNPIGDIVFFLHTVPMIAALTIQPDMHHDNRKLQYGYVDFSLLLSWWVYLYLFAVIPWQYVVVNDLDYRHAFNVICTLENLVFAAGAMLLSLRATGRWRRIYAHLAGAGAMYTVASLVVNLAIHRHVYSTGSVYDLPAIASLLWLGTAGMAAYGSGSKGYPSKTAESQEMLSSASASRNEVLWASRLARAALFSLALIGIWCVKISQAPMAVREFRTLVTLAAVLPLGFLVFLRHELMDAERLSLLRISQESIDNLKRLQMQFVQSEKLASLGQLAAGAAHEINNPLTAILGYSELLIDDPSSGERARSLAEKIRDQARRTKLLVNNLLSFARQVPSEQRSVVDVNAVVTSSAQLRRLDLRGKNIRIELQTAAAIPAVRGDPNQLLQVFFNIINNAVDAMEEVSGGTLTVRTLSERENVVILFSDTGPGVSEPRLVFDPFYTTKPVGKGTGLGLSICYGLIHDHGGQISCYNRAEGGATFRIELPAVPAMFPSRVFTTLPRGTPVKSS